MADQGVAATVAYDFDLAAGPSPDQEAAIGFTVPLLGNPYAGGAILIMDNPPLLSVALVSAADLQVRDLWQNGSCPRQPDTLPAPAALFRVLRPGDRIGRPKH